MWPFSKNTSQRIEVIRRDSTTLRLDEWRSQPELVKLADAVWRNQDFRLMFQIAQTESPGNFAVLTGDLETRALHQARTEGYNLALAKLKSMRVLIEKEVEVQSEYVPEETE